VLPWDDSDRPPSINYGLVDAPALAGATLAGNFALCALRIKNIPPSQIVKPAYSSKQSQPGVVHPLKPMPATVLKITGISKDSAGAPLGSCVMSLFRVDADSGNNLVYTFISNTTSDATTGSYTFNVNRNYNYMVTSNKVTVAGITLNTLTGV
jgi:hypothetical protein